MPRRAHVAFGRRCQLDATEDSMMSSIRRSAIVVAVSLSALVSVPIGAQTAPLASWNDGPTKQAILNFVRATTDRSSQQFVPPDERIATFDNDGTLWVEQPLYTQGIFALERVGALAEDHPEWKTTEPFKSVLERDEAAMAKFTEADWEKIVAATHSGMTVEAFNEIAAKWLATATDKRFKRHYTELVYQPMLELLSYLRANGYKTYIVTGGGQDFVRAFASKVYGVPLEQVVGTAGKTKLVYAQNGQAELIKAPEILYVDDKTGKPEGIHLVIGRRPWGAFGNSDGDMQMLQWTQAGGGPRLMMLVHHDDAQREYAYGAKSKVGTFSDSLMAVAKKGGWTVISIKNDWRRVFPFDP
jgi:phosphoglycolate phosphatase-like HAD superfamily hydrolase